MNKLYIPALALALVGGSVHAQHAGGITKIASKQANSSSVTTRTGGRATPAAGAQREIIWSDDFSNPSNWVAGNVAGASDDTWVIGTDGPSGAFAIDPILHREQRFWNVRL